MNLSLFSLLTSYFLLFINSLYAFLVQTLESICSYQAF